MPVAVEVDEATSSDMSTKEKILSLKDKAKIKATHALHIRVSGVEEDAVRTPHEAALQEINESPAFNPSSFLNQARIGPAGSPDKSIAFIQGTADAILHPKTTIKQKATQKTAKKLAKSGAYLSRQTDLDFLEAHDNLQRAEGIRNDNDDDKTAARKDGKIDECEEHIDDMELKRQSMRVAWVTARHVQRVRVVDAMTPPQFPDDSFFEEEDDCGFKQFNWGKWLAYKLLLGTHSFTAQYIDDFDELPFDSDTLRRHIERWIIVSAPLQTLISEIRCIYRWQDPVRTGKWLSLYCFLWYISHIMTFFYGYIVYITMKNYYYPTSLEVLREGIERTIDRGATAFKIGELMDKHGSDDWLGPFVDHIGPEFQIFVADFASLLEATYNFYHFRRPEQTAYTLCLFVALFLVTAFTDSQFSMKIYWLIIGLVFFGCWPISSLHPRYRLLVSPFKLVLWNVPNHAEWCFQYLQERAALAKKTIIAEDIDDNHYVQTGKSEALAINDSLDSDASSFHSARDDPASEEERDILSFGCTCLKMPGRFIISTHGVRFISSMGHVLPSTSFHRPYTDLVEMSKRQTTSSILSPLAKVTTDMDKLELRFRGPRDGAGMRRMGEREHADIVTLENMRGRDKAFNSVIGFSGLRWQHLQKKPEEKKDAKKSDAKS